MSIINLELYSDHVTEKLTRFRKILEDFYLEEVIISSGEVQTPFADDIELPFNANPYFREWIPLTKRAGSYLKINKTDSLPTLYLREAEDVWNTPPESLPEGYAASFYLITYEKKVDLVGGFVKDGGCAFIGQDNVLEMPPSAFNPRRFLNAIDHQRRVKTPYEHACLREANRLAAPAHVAAREAFYAGQSELEIARIFAAACGCSDNGLPYPVIAGINQNSAILHHYRLNPRPTSNPLSFLIDAGAEVQGYVSDITRTIAKDSHSEFAAMIEYMDRVQHELISDGGIGQNPLPITLSCQRKIAECLQEFGVLKGSVDAALACRVVDSFFPHSFGHDLGSCVHDKGVYVADATTGKVFPSPEDKNEIRERATMVANQVYTAEPGVYFIPALLKKLREGENGKMIDWEKVEQFVPYGGIRIEDNLILHEDGRIENMTRDALAEAGY